MELLDTEKSLPQSNSAADSAFERYRAVIADQRLFGLDHALLSETDTRVKLIDPLFGDVLGWHEAEIRREKPVTKGYIDYVLGSEFSFLLVEAKRSKPRFRLSAPGKPRRLKLDGPHLLENKKVRPVIEQAQSYANDVGVQFCIVTNGSQYIIFRPYVPGRPWRKGTAIVYHDHQDIETNFADFFNLLSRDRVISGSLVEAFEYLEHTLRVLYSPLSYIKDPDRELVRNKVWQQIARIMGPLLTDRSEDSPSQLEVISNCYVTTSLGDETDSSLDSRAGPEK